MRKRLADMNENEREAARAYMRAYRKANSNRLNQKRRERYSADSDNRAKRLASSRQGRINASPQAKARKRERRKAWYNKNRRREIEKTLRWLRANPEKRLENKRRYYSRRK